MTVSATLNQNGTYAVTGLSSDTKPDGVPAGSTFLETDTGISWIYDGVIWTRTSGATVGNTTDTAPGPSNDSTEGYSIGSRWWDTTANAEYVCVVATPGAAVWRITTETPPVTPSGIAADALLSGSAAWDTGLSFNVSALTYILGGSYGTSLGGSITLDPADPLLDRIDVLVVDSTGTIGKVTGTPAATPVKPALGFDQLEITTLSVVAAALTPTGISVTDVYLENAGTPTEWAATTTAPARVNLASTTTPYEGLLDIEATSAFVGDEIRFAPVANVNVSGFSTLELWIKAKAGWPAGTSKSIQICFEKDGVLNGVWVNIVNGAFGFSSANTSTYQIIPIPMSSFALTDPFVTRLRVYVVGGGTFGFFMDRVRLQTGVPLPTTSSSTDSFAIHSNVASEISGITEKTVPVATDLLVIEDSAAGNIKKSIQIGNLPGDPTNAIHKNVAAEISTVTEKLIPVAADLILIEDSASGNVKKRAKLSNLAAALGVTSYGQNYQVTTVSGRSTTTSSVMQNKATLTTPVLTGTFRIAWSCLVDIGTNYKVVEARLFNSTDSTVVGLAQPIQPARSADVSPRSGYADVVLAGVSKTYRIQFRSPDGTTTVGCQDARIEFWKVS